MFGIWMVNDEVKPCHPGTNDHDRSAGKWYGAGASWCTDHGEKLLFECEHDAIANSVMVRHERRNAHPPFTLITPRRYGPTSAGEMMPCVLDLSGVGGWMREVAR